MVEDIQNTLEETDLSHWHILVVDDDRDIHALTNIVLEDIEVYGKRLKIYSAYSVDEACNFIKEKHEINLVLLDMIMEDEDSGERVMKFIRKELKNLKVRVILRTGKADILSQGDLIKKFDISDFNVKSELSAKEFRSSIIEALEEYDEMSEIPTEIIAIKAEIKNPIEQINKIQGLLLDLENTSLDERQIDLLNSAQSSLKELKEIIAS